MDPQVRRFLETQGERFDGVVAADGTVFVVAGSLTRRQQRPLLDTVREQLGAAELVEVTPTEFRRWTDRRQGRSANEQAAARDRANDTVRYIFGMAIEQKASDVYLDIREGHSTVSFRTYGFSREFERFSREAGLSLATAIWALGKNTQFEPGRVCDAAFDFEHDDHRYRIRANSMKEVRGNSVVCRVRDPSFVLPLDESGYSERQALRIQRMCRAPGGLIIISGETNSGKSTSLTGLMARMPAWMRVMELADPVEAVMDNVVHVEVEHYGENAETKLEESLGGTVRQNPDALVIGEIRDRQTAEAAQKMANQGKRVLSTLHTQSCVAAIPRLVDLGVTQNLLAVRSFFAGVVNQNLVPIVCPACGRAEHEDAEVDRYHRERFGDGIRFVDEEGCPECNRGVSGQTLVAEVYPLYLDRSGRAYQLIGRGELTELEQYMRGPDGPGGGCATKHQHAAGKIAEGLIDPEHTERIIGEFAGEDLGGFRADRGRVVAARGLRAG